MERKYNPPAIRRAVRILEYLAEADRPVRLTQIATALGYSKSTVHGLLGALETLNWVERGGGGDGYRVGKGLLSLSRKAFGVWEISEMARPLMQRLAESTGESVFLGTRQGNRVVIVACAEGRNEMRVTSPPGTVIPLLAAATGKVFLAAMPQEEAEETLTGTPLPRFTERSIVNPDDFRGEVARARERGYATDDEEYLRGVRAVAAPIRSGQSTVAAMWVVGFVSSLTDRAMERTARELVEATHILSSLIESRAPS